MPSAMAFATPSAESDPLNESGAMTTTGAGAAGVTLSMVSRCSDSKRSLKSRLKCCGHAPFMLFWHACDSPRQCMPFATDCAAKLISALRAAK
jgi:hypothetical protein